MMKSKKGNTKLDAALVEIARDLGGSAISKATADKITMRVLGTDAPAKPAMLAAADIRALREAAGMSQAVFARYLNLTTGYVAQLERGAKRPTGAALALLHVIRRKGIEAVQ